MTTETTAQPTEPKRVMGPKLPWTSGRPMVQYPITGFLVAVAWSVNRTTRGAATTITRVDDLV